MHNRDLNDSIQQSQDKGSQFSHFMVLESTALDVFSLDTVPFPLSLTLDTLLALIVTKSVNEDEIVNDLTYCIRQFDAARNAVQSHVRLRNTEGGITYDNQEERTDEE